MKTVDRSSDVRTWRGPCWSLSTIVMYLAATLAGHESRQVAAQEAVERPNVLIAISDDQSWPHASAYGSKMCRTPSFDRIAREGVLFTHAFAASPGCSPSRAALLTGMNTWQLEHAGTHASYFAPKFVTFADRLSESGYFVGHTGKGWGPGDFATLGRPHNPSGKAFSAKRTAGSARGYVGAFENFLEQRPAGMPFCFWFGSNDPHRGFEQGSGLRAGKSLEDAEVPGFLPDAEEVRSDLLDYSLEVERFDDDLGKFVALLEQAGELDRTIIIVTSDNGMSFPRAKANCYEHGIRVPLAIRWGAIDSTGRTVDDLVGFTDLTATIYDLTDVAPPKETVRLTGKSLRDILLSDATGSVDASRDAVFAARERHSSSRFNSLGYPQRAMRTRRYLYIRNFKPERWPAGPSSRYATVTYADDGTVLRSTLAGSQQGYHDIDACPTLQYLVANRSDPAVGRFLDLAVARRPAEELFDVESDPYCLADLANSPSHQELLVSLRDRLDAYLRETGDARLTDQGDVWETYPRMSALRWFPEPDWVADPKFTVPRQPWLEERRPREK